MSGKRARFYPAPNGARGHVEALCDLVDSQKPSRPTTAPGARRNADVGVAAVTEKTGNPAFTLRRSFNCNMATRFGAILKKNAMAHFANHALRSLKPVKQG
jgi:hypothetical protein